jgi:hypothetical protein
MGARGWPQRQDRRHRHAQHVVLASDAPSESAATEDHIDGKSGVASLLLGFDCEAVGYVLDLVGVADAPADSTARTLTALALLVLAVIVAGGAGRLSGTRLLQRLLIEMAPPTRAGEAAEYRDQATPAMLAYWAGDLGHPRRDGDDDWEYAKRAYGLETITTGTE